MYSRCRFGLESSGEDGFVLPTKLDCRSLADSLSCSSSDQGKSRSSLFCSRLNRLLVVVFAPNAKSPSPCCDEAPVTLLSFFQQSLSYVADLMAVVLNVVVIGSVHL